MYSDLVGYQTSDIGLLWTSITQTMNPSPPSPLVDALQCHDGRRVQAKDEAAAHAMERVLFVPERDGFRSPCRSPRQGRTGECGSGCKDGLRWWHSSPRFFRAALPPMHHETVSFTGRVDGALIMAWRGMPFLQARFLGGVWPIALIFGCKGFRLASRLFSGQVPSG